MASFSISLLTASSKSQRTLYFDILFFGVALLCFVVGFNSPNVLSLLLCGFFGLLFVIVGIYLHREIAESNKREEDSLYKIQKEYGFNKTSELTSSLWLDESNKLMYIESYDIVY